MAGLNHSGADWDVTDCAVRPLDLAATLSSGQAFRWRRDAAGIWWGTVGATGVALWQREQEPDAPLYWRTFPRAHQRELVEQYLAMDVALSELYEQWIRAEPAIAPAVRAYRGLRILRQPPVECFFAFQCATCNTVVKIERSVHRLAERYGHAVRLDASDAVAAAHEARYGIATGGAPADLPALDNLPPLFTFPDIEALSRASEADLRSDLWGYRAPRVVALAQALRDFGAGWLPGLTSMPYAGAKGHLVALHGIGEKVADCICLFSLGKPDAVPVDTHVRQIACSLFAPELAFKSLTPRVYAAIAAAYRDRFGAHAGWAQQYLFLGAMRARRRQ